MQKLKENQLMIVSDLALYKNALKIDIYSM